MTDKSKILFHAAANDFEKIPEAPVAYWVSENVYKTYSHPQIGTVIVPRHGLATSDNNRFLKMWHEVDLISCGIINKCEFSRKCFPMNKGGNFRKWFGNQEWVINYENDGKEIKDFAIKLYSVC